MLTSWVCVTATLLEIEDDHPERGNRLRPFDAGIVMTGFDDSPDQARNAYPIRASVDRTLDTVGPRHVRLHRHRVFGSEVENLPYFNTASMEPLVRRDLPLEPHGIVHIGCGRVEGRPRTNVRRKVSVVIDVSGRDWQVQHVLVAEHPGFAGLGQ